MSATAVSSTLLSQQSQGNFQQRRIDLKQLSQDLQSNNLAGAQRDFAQLQNTFHDQASADTGAAVVVKLGGSTSVSSAITSAADGPPISTGGSTGRVFTSGADEPPVSGGGATQRIFTSGADAPPVNAGGSSTSSGSSPITSAADAPPLNLNKSSNQEIVLNLLNSIASGPAQSNGISVTA
jgi:hypothetical protein